MFPKKRRIGLIYQLFLGRHDNSNRIEHSGQVLRRMQNWPWQNLSKAGFTHVYLLGLFSHDGAVHVQEEEGQDLQRHHHRTTSIFALTDHQKVDSHLGSETDIRQLIHTLHQKNLAVVVDFVPNHTAIEHPWVTSHPEYYHLIEGQLVQEFSGDVVKLNYDNPKLAHQMVLTADRILQLGVDGIRVDMAHLIPNHFWQSTIPQLKAKNPNFICIAEAYADSVMDWNTHKNLIESGFDFIYNETLFRNINTYHQGHLNDQDLCNLINFLSTNDLSQQLVHYLMNHDDTLNESAQEYLPIWVAILLLLPGTELFFNGQFLGQKQRLAHHWLQLLAADKSEVFAGFPQWFTTLQQLIQSYNWQLTSIQVVRSGEFEIQLKGSQTAQMSFSLKNDPKMNVADQQGHILWSTAEFNALRHLQCSIKSS